MTQANFFIKCSCSRLAITGSPHILAINEPLHILAEFNNHVLFTRALPIKQDIKEADEKFCPNLLFHC